VGARFEIVEALDRHAVAECRALFVEYQQGLGVSLCFQDFDRELAGLPGEYAPPHGKLFLARAPDGQAIGCAALRALDDGAGEMKRLYVRGSARGCGLGDALARKVIAAALELGYRAVKLDTLPTMHTAQALYARLGFRDIPQYNDNPVAGTRFMGLSLRDA
jgi:putative acetyltransferase